MMVHRKESAYVFIIWFGCLQIVSYQFLFFFHNENETVAAGKETPTTRTTAQLVHRQPNGAFALANPKIAPSENRVPLLCGRTLTNVAM
jgi:hypothetical protein